MISLSYDLYFKKKEVMVPLVWSKLKSHFTRNDRHEKERVDCVVEELSVNGQYTASFRTKSYVEIWRRTKDQLRRKSLNRLVSSSSSPSSIHLYESLLQPQQETLVETIQRSNLHPLIVEYFEASFEACKLCELLLCNVHQACVNYRIIQRAIELTKRTDGCTYATGPVTKSRDSRVLRFLPRTAAGVVLRQEDKTVWDRGSLAGTEYTDAQSNDVLEDLASFVVLKNPLLAISPKLHDLHGGHDYLHQRLEMKMTRVRKRAKFNRYFKKTIGFSLVVSYGALEFALLVLAVHSIVGIVAVPPVVACSLVLLKKWRKLAERGLKMRSVEMLGAQLDIARRGVFYSTEDFETIRLLAKRLEDEIESIKFVSDMCVGNGNMEVVRKVVEKFEIEETGFLEKLKELEKQICLCFVNINRSRMQVMNEMMVLQEVHR